MTLSKELRKLKQDIEQGAAKNGERFDRYAFNVFSHQAKHWEVNGTTQEEREEGARLKSLAVKRSHELEAIEAILAQDNTAALEDVAIFYGVPKYGHRHCYRSAGGRTEPATLDRPGVQTLLCCECGKPLIPQA